MAHRLDVETFISEVKKYPEIWDLTSEDNRFKNRKQHAWKQIARIFIKDFDHMQEIEKLDVFRKLNGKWRNIRDSYVRHLKKKYGKKGYMYAKHLTFLEHMYKQNGQSGSDGEPENNENFSQSDDDSKLNVGFKKKFDGKSSNSSWISEEEIPSTIDSLKRKRISKQDTSIEYVAAPYSEPTCSYTVEDEDRSFFESLLPAVRRFDLDQKLEFRSEVIRLIKNIRCKANGTFKLELSEVDFDE